MSDMKALIYIGIFIFLVNVSGHSHACGDISTSTPPVLTQDIKTL